MFFDNDVTNDLLATDVQFIDRNSPAAPLYWETAGFFLVSVCRPFFRGLADGAVSFCTRM
ncbi:hypothetical protein ACI2UK_13940 [Ralstonia nicotianae]|uniref:hypothetical protein n=1 Tax=Ralstonia pseudosolanacearum TaxID=1310165 RepID=UPI002002BD57|nr:hypothetical protein [Ralstonia pseudosolanacearum]MCK4118355.1 hypothetical protein [Ralstonia pseudosolanacearum]